MAWLSETDRERLRDELSDKLAAPVELRLAASDAAAGRQAVEVLEELAALSPRITLSRLAPTDLDPRFELRGRARGKLGYVGLPMGHEFPTLVEAIVDVSRGETSLAPVVRDRLSELAELRHLRVFTTPT